MRHQLIRVEDDERRSLALVHEESSRRDVRIQAVKCRMNTGGRLGTSAIGLIAVGKPCQ